MHIHVQVCNNKTYFGLVITSLICFQGNIQLYFQLDFRGQLVVLLTTISTQLAFPLKFLETQKFSS